MDVRRIAYHAFVAVSTVLLVLFFAGYVSRYIHPLYGWWAEIIAVGLPYVTILLVGFAGVSILYKSWRLSGLFALALILAVFRFMPASVIPTQQSESPDDLTVLVFNVTHWSDDVDLKSQQLQELVADVSPELIAFQEAPLHYTPDGAEMHSRAAFLREVMDSLEYDYAPIDINSRSSRYRRNDQPVLARVPLIDQETIFLDDGEMRGRANAVRTTFEWQGREAVIFNVHLRSFGRDKPWSEGLRGPLSLEFWRRYLSQYRVAFRDRANEAERLRQRVDEEERPVIIAGDFNSTPHSWIFQKLLRGKQDAFRQAGRGWGSTYHSELPLVRIDHLLASPEWKVTGARVIKEYGADLSQHRPLVVRLQWRE